MVGNGKPVQAAYGYQPAKLKGLSPVLIVVANGTDYLNPRTEVYGGNPVAFNVQTRFMALYSDKTNSYTNADAETILDDLEERMRLLVRANREHAKWADITYRGATQKQFVTDVEGFTYLAEDIPLRFDA